MTDTDLEFEDTASPPEKPAKRAPGTRAPRPEVPPDAELYEKVTQFPAAVPATSRSVPHSLEAEEYLIACCIMDGADVIGKCLRSRIGPGSFYDSKHGLLFRHLVALYHRNAKIIDITVLAEELKTAKQLDHVGGYAFLAQVTSRIPTTAQASYFIDTVREKALLRDVIREATRAIENAHGFTGGIDDFIDVTTSGLATVVNSARREIANVAAPITSFDYPTREDPNVLLGTDDYLGRGGGMLFVSHAGAGKSSFIMDACMSWGLGVPWMGIRSNGALKSLIIQAEDSDRYVGKVVRSFVGARKLAVTEVTTLAENVVIVRIRGTTGLAFFAELERLVAIHQPDLVVINPIYLYAEGDISKSDSAQPFVVGLDRVNREMRFGYILVHHTGKPQQKSPNGKRAELDDWETIYMGFGSSYLANWPRCSALLEPRGKENGRYWLKLGKAGGNAGVTKKTPVQGGVSFRHEPTTRIALRHSAEVIDVGGHKRPAIYWELDEHDAPDGEDQEEKQGAESRERRTSNRPSKFSVSQFREMFVRECPCVEKRKGYNALHRAACDVLKIGGSAFNSVLLEAIDTGVLSKTDGKYHLP